MTGTGRDPEQTPAGQPSDPPVGVTQRLDGTQQRIRELHVDLRRSQEEARELRVTVQRIERESSRRAGLLIEADALVTAMETGVHALRHSISLQVGYLITRSARSVRGMLALPYRIAKLMLEARRSVLSKPGETRRIVEVPLPHDWFPPAVRQQLTRFHAEYASEADSAMRGGGKAMSLPPRVNGLPVDASDLRIAAIMDEFTFNAYRDCCDVKAVTPEGWREELELHKPHLLFIESAWDGKGGLWQRKISNASPELRQLVSYCRRIGVPVIFWSKEDPVHFKTFLDTARLADFVFTTDIDCIKHYKIALGHERVYLLPFATQPRAHDPIERYDRKRAFCFAGSYYVRYPTRQQDFANLMAAVSTLAPVDIYDRNHGKTHPNYIFPERYRPYILGSLPFDQIDIAYKGYQFGINVNTVKHSQSMFARRVFDLLASNTVTVSNYSRGMQLAFGDLVIASDDSGQLISKLKPLVEDPIRLSKFRLAGLRKVMREHTYQHRLAYVVAKVFGHVSQVQGAKVVVLANVSDDLSLRAAIANFRRQRWAQKRLLVSLAPGFLPANPFLADDIEVILADQNRHRKLVELLPDGYYLALFEPGDYYGPNYLVDLALATCYSRVDAVGKRSYYRLDSNTVQLENSGKQYQISADVALQRALVLPRALGELATLEWAQTPRAVPAETLALDEFNYCAGATAHPAEGVRVTVDDVDDLDEGLPITKLLSMAESIEGGTLAFDAEEQHGIEEVGSDRLHSLLGTLNNKYLSARHDDNGLIIESTVPLGKHAYCYLGQALPAASVNLTDVARMQLVCEPGQGLELVLVFQDETGGKLGHSIVKAATNITAAVPVGTSQLLIGLRVSSAGRFTIKRLALDHIPMQVDTIISRSRTLLLAKNYPSYRDRYKHAFVHRRALGYARCGADVDVFRIGSGPLCFSEHEGVAITEGQFEHLRAVLASGRYRNILAHVLTEQAWEVLERYVSHTRVYVWAHGSEVQPWTRRAFEYSTDAERHRATVLSDRRMSFWRALLKTPHPNLVMVFVSRHLAEAMFEDLGFRLPDSQYRIIHNFVDGDLFNYREKSPEQRTRILSIRPYAGRVYANDLTVQAIVELSRREFFGELQFHLIGDGALFDQTVEPVRKFPNVKVERRFLSQREIAELHADYGVFLCPTRMDSQGVSRDEAMASGLVPITNPVAAVPEFVDESCGLLVEPESAIALADAIERLYRDAALFARLSAAAAARVRSQSAFETTIAREIKLFDGQAECVGT